MKFKIIEFTGSGAGFPSATDTGGGQAIDKISSRREQQRKRNERKKVKLVKRVIPKTIS